MYLNAAGTSWPKPEPVREAAARALEADPDDWGESFDRAHRAVAAFVHVPDPARLLLTPAATSALALAVADHAWSAGDRVLTSAMEHHALARPLTKLAALGVAVERIPRAPAGGPLDLDALEAALRRGGVRMVALSMAANVTGELLPTAEATRLAREHGALVLLDAAQVAGWVELDLPGLGADLVAFAGHKGLQAPWGIGGLWVAPDHAMEVVGASCALQVPGASAGPCAPMPGYCDGGSVDRAALAGLEAATAWLAERPDRLARARAQAARIWRALEAIDGVELLGDPDPAARLPTVAFRHRRTPTGTIAEQLRARGVIAGAGVVCAPDAHEALGTAPEGVVRLSVGPAVTDGEIDAALATLDEVIPRRS